MLQQVQIGPEKQGDESAGAEEFEPKIKQKQRPNVLGRWVPGWCA